MSSLNIAYFCANSNLLMDVNVDQTVPFLRDNVTPIPIPQWTAYIVVRRDDRVVLTGFVDMPHGRKYTEQVPVVWSHPNACDLIAVADGD